MITDQGALNSFPDLQICRRLEKMFVCSSNVMKFCDPPAKEPTRKNGGMRTNEMMTSRRVVFFSEQLAPGFQSIPRLTKIGKWFTSFPPLRNSEAQRKLYIYTHTYYELIVFPPIFFFCYYRLTHLSGFGCVIGWWCHWRLSSTSLVSLHNKH